MAKKNSKGQGKGAPRDTGKFIKTWKKMKKGQKVAIVLAAAFLVLIGSGVWYYASVLNNPIKTLGPKKNPLSTDPGADKVSEAGDSMDELNNWRADDYYDKNIINFVLLGFDTNDERRDMSGKGWGAGFAGARPDSIRVISIDLDTMTSNVISIPRDTYIQIADTNTKDKINSSYTYGRIAAHQKGLTKEEEINDMGMEYVMKTISNVLGGVPMDYYMAVDFDTVVKFVDAIGGVRYDVDITVTAPDGTVMLEKGMQTLNGTQAFIYLQDRKHTPDGDIGRTAHHTMFLKAMMKQLVDQHKLMDALKFVIFDDSMGTVETNMTVDQIMSAGWIAKELNLTDINPHTLEVRYANMDGVSYVVMDQQARSDLIKQVFDYEFPVQPQEHLVDTVPAPPTDFTAKATPDGIVLDWNPGDTHNRSYNVYRNNTLIAPGIIEDMYLDTEAPGGELTYAVQAVNGASVSTKVTAAVQAGAGAPTNLKASFDEDTYTVELTWDCSDYDSFTIYRSDGNGTGARYARDIRDKSFSDSAVSYGKTYTYRVVAVKDGKESAAATVQIEIDTKVTSYTLTMAKTGSGTGTLTPSAGAYKENSGTVVSIEATPTGGSTFEGWTKSGDCTIADSSDPTTTVTVNGDCTVTATFKAPAASTYTLTMSKGGAGTGDITPGTSTQTAGVAVNITATPTGGSTFGGWTVTSGSATFGDASSKNTTVTASADCTIKATFKAPAATTYTLTMSKGGAGTGDITPGTSTQTAGVAVNITATPTGGSTFGGWTVTSGSATFGDAGSASTTVTASADCQITATFNAAAPTTYTLNIGVDPADSGTTTGQGSDLSGSVAISATANAGFTFDHWGGADAGKVADVNAASTTVTVDKNISIKAVFVATP